jgi:cytochrome P450
MRAMERTVTGPRRPGIVQVVEFTFWPERYVMRNVRRHGAVFRMKGPIIDLWATASPEHAKRVFAADPDTFGTLGTDSLKGILGARSVLVTDGPLHRRQRKLLTPPLHGPRLRAFAMSMQAIAREHIGRLRTGQRLLAHDLTTDFTLDVILRTVFGVEEGPQMASLRELLTHMLAGISPLSIFLPLLQTPRFPPHRKFLAVRERFDRAVDRLIDERRGEERADVLSLLCAARYEDGEPMERSEIRDQLVTLLLAGHETTAITLAWALDLVLRRPEVLDRIESEIRGVDDPEQIAKLPYLGAAIDETMRLVPVVTDVARIPKVPFELEPGLVVPKGVPIVVLIEAIHRDPSLYPEPERYRPERFLERRFSPTEFLPFGGGNRRCLGAAFSEQEARLFLAMPLDDVRLRPTSARPPRRVRRNITMGPDDGVPLEVLCLRAS